MIQIHRFVRICLISIFIIQCPNIIFATTIDVPGDQVTIQAAIDVAVDGDKVLVADGTYTGEGNKNLDFKGKAITVQSENGYESCIIDCENDGKGFYFHNREKADSILSGFTITNGFSPFGAGITCEDSSSPTIKNCNIEQNSTGSSFIGGGGIACYQRSSPIIYNCIIRNNSTNNYYGGGGISIWYSSPQINRCQIYQNIGSYKGGGIYCTEISSSPKIYNCSIIGNISNDGGGIYCEGSNVWVESCLISENTANNYGGGILLTELSSSSSTIINCVFYKNRSSRGAAISCDSSSPNIINCSISNNLATRNGGGIYTDYGCNVLNSILWANSPDEIYGDSSVSYSNINGGYEGTGNLNLLPKFISDTDYRLNPSSPCIDSGTSTNAPSTDIDGILRPFGMGYDMGAYEYHGEEPLNISPEANAGTDQIVLNEITLNGSDSSDEDGYIISYDWQIIHRENSAYNRTATGITPTISNLNTGFYDVFLTVADNQGGTNTDTMLLTVSGGQQSGSLTVTLSPATAVTAGGQWQVDSTGVWNNSGATISSLTVGTHTVSFKDVTDWTTPVNQTITIQNGVIATANGTYIKIELPENVTSYKVLTDQSPEVTINYGEYVRVFGSSGGNTITVKSGGRAECVNFVGSNIVNIKDASSGFTVNRSGATVYLSNLAIGTRIKIPATKTLQTIIFNDITRTLVIDNNQVRLGNQVVNLTSNPIL